MNFRIKEARQAANLTQRQLADMLGIKDTTLSGYEVGLHDPKSNTLAEIARICNTTVDYLLGLTEKGEFDLGELSHDEADFIRMFNAMTPVNRRLILGISELLLKEQEGPAGSQE